MLASLCTPALDAESEALVQAALKAAGALHGARAIELTRARALLCAHADQARGGRC